MITIFKAIPRPPDLLPLVSISLWFPISNCWCNLLLIALPIVDLFYDMFSAHHDYPFSRNLLPLHRVRK